MKTVGTIDLKNNLTGIISTRELIYIIRRASKGICTGEAEVEILEVHCRESLRVVTINTFVFNYD